MDDSYEVKDRVPVLNGTARVGDRLAVARGEGRAGGMSVGEILEIQARPVFPEPGQRQHYRVKVRVDLASGFRGRKCNTETGSWEFHPYIKTYDKPDHMVKLPPLPRDSDQAYLGQRVKVTLSRPEGEPAVIIQGKLLGFGQCGEFEIEEDDGLVHYCWPMLNVEPSETL